LHHTSSRVTFVLYMLLLPPRPTLFPYTTLFRSSAKTGWSAAFSPCALRQRARCSRQGFARPASTSAGSAAPSPRRTSQVHWRRRSEEHTSELQSHLNLVCRLLLEKKKNNICNKH